MLTVLTANSQAGGFTIANSLRFRSSASAYLNRTLTTPANAYKWTWSGWLKRGVFADVPFFSGYNTGALTRTFISFSSDTILFYQASGSGGSITYPVRFFTTPVYRDPSAWYHIILSYDSTQATSTNRVSFYVNGVQVTNFSVADYPSQNYACDINAATTHTICRDGYNNTNGFDGYLTEINFVDGQALTPSSFGETSSTTGVWVPKKYTGSYGTNGFYLNFSNGTSTTTLGYDSSSNGNNWTTNNISLTSGATYDWMIDSPTSYAGTGYGVGNYAVLNPVVTSTGAFSITNGNLDFSGSGYGSFGANASIFVSSGKWYWEMTANAKATTDALTFGIYGLGAQSWNGGTNSYIYRSDGYKRGNGTSSAYGASYTAADIIGVALDLDAGTMTFYKNNSSQGAAFTGLSGSFSPSSSADQGAGTTSGTANFGQRPFAYTPPTGYKALNTQNLSAPSIVNGAAYMAATLYTGTGSSVSISNAVNGVGFQPDLVWAKARSTGFSHGLFDSVRGTNNALRSNTTSAETNEVNTLTAFNSTGFTVGADATGLINYNGTTYVGWQWKAGGTAVTNTAGSITSSVSANTTSGFSVVTYTGTGSAATVGHGLGKAPNMMIVKSRSSVTNWYVYHASMPSANYYLALNATAAQSNTNGSTLWNSTAPTSSLISLGTSVSTNANATSYLIYCFAAIPGYSAFGSYTGNNSADGPFVYCGFRPRYLMVKRTDSTGAWEIYDTSRSPYNVTGAKDLQADSASAEGASGISLGYDILSNGFKNRDTTSYLNASGGTYIYACFAESPFQLSLAR